MKQPLLEKTILRELLKYDALAEAEKISGKSYKEDDGVSFLAMALMRENNETKGELLDLNDDTKLNNKLDKYLRITKEEGFEIVLKEDFVYEGQSDALYVLWNDEDGILLKFDTYWSDDVNGGSFYYNWIPNELDNSSWRGTITESGGFADKRGEVWAGHHDCREALRLHLHGLREKGTFVKPWVKNQFLWLLHYADTKDKNYNYHAINAQRIAKLPENVQKCICAEQMSLQIQ